MSTTLRAQNLQASLGDEEAGLVGDAPTSGYVYVAGAAMAVLACVCVVAVLAGAAGAITGGISLFKVNSLSDDVDDLESFLDRTVVANFNVLVNMFGAYPLRPLSDNDKTKHAAANLDISGYTTLHPKYNGDQEVIDAGGFDSFVPAAFHAGATIVGDFVTNCTTTTELVNVWSGSDSIFQGEVVGSRKGNGAVKAVSGFADYEYITIDDASDLPEASVVFAVGDDSALVMGLNSDDVMITTPAVGAPDDHDGMEAGTALLGGTYTGTSLRFGLFASQQHSDHTHYLTVRRNETADTGGVAELCLINAMSPFSVTCSTPVAFVTNETIVMVGLNHIPDSEIFVATYVSETEGLVSIVATVNRNTLSVTLSAPVVINAAATDTIYETAEVLLSGSTLTYLYIDATNSIPLTVQRYTISGATLSSVVAATTLIDLDAGTSFGAANVGPDHFAIGIMSPEGNAYGDLRLFSSIGSIMPTLAWRTPFLNPHGFEILYGYMTPVLTPIADDAIILTYVGDSGTRRPLAQVWHLYTASTGPTMIPGQDKAFDVYTSTVPRCATLGEGDRAVCISSGNSASSSHHNVRLTKFKSFDEADPTFSRALVNVFEGADMPLGIAMHNAEPSTQLLVGTSGCFSSPNGDSRYANKGQLYLHGNGQVMPNSEAVGDVTYVPRPGCKRKSDSTFTCSLIGA